MRYINRLYMNRKNIIVLFFFTYIGASSSLCQQLLYSSQESDLIHDSIGKSRWDVGGRLSHYSFRYMAEFFPIGLIYKPTASFSFQNSINSAIADLPVHTKQDTSTFEKVLKSIHVNSIIIVHKGKILFEKYYGMLPDEQHTLQSVTKVITAALIAKLENDKKVDLSKAVESYLPELKNTAWQGIRVRDILYMKSGIEGAESVSGDAFTNPKHPYYNFEAALGILPRTDSTPASVFRYIASLKRKWSPGEKTEYHSVNTFILGWIAERITGKKYADLVTEVIWKPMGASSNAYVCLSNKGVPWTHGGLSATLRDVARFGMLFTKSDVEQRNDKIISQAQIEQILDAENLGYQWDWSKKGEGMHKAGFGGQGLFVNPETGFVVAYFNFVDEKWGHINLIPVIKQVENAVLKKQIQKPLPLSDIDAQQQL